MLQALLSHDDKTAYFNVPHNSLEVENYLLAVGALKPYTDLRLNDDDDDPEQVHIKLIAETAIDNEELNGVLNTLYKKNVHPAVRTYIESRDADASVATAKRPANQGKEQTNG